MTRLLKLFPNSCKGRIMPDGSLRDGDSGVGDQTTASHNKEQDNVCILDSDTDDDSSKPNLPSRPAPAPILSTPGNRTNPLMID